MKRFLIILVAVGLGGLAGYLMWPTDECIRTLVGGAENTPTCTTIIGLPGSKNVAVLLGLVVTFLVWSVIRKLTQKRGD